MTTPQREVILVAHNVRSTHNVGSLLRTAEGCGIHTVYLTGYTPYPTHAGDTRLPHERLKVTKSIQKTALGAEQMLSLHVESSLMLALSELRQRDYTPVALEQTDDATPIPVYLPPSKLALVIGNEVTGLPDNDLALCDQAILIPMRGHKESFNVVQATAMALFRLCYLP